jgi:methylmalonyl-CoA mutase C-terminal domain/subunit
MKQNKMEDVLLIGGGIIPDDDAVSLNNQGVAKLFAPGTAMDEIIQYIRENTK